MAVDAALVAAAVPLEPRHRNQRCTDVVSSAQYDCRRLPSVSGFVISKPPCAVRSAGLYSGGTSNSYASRAASENLSNSTLEIVVRPSSV